MTKVIVLVLLASPFLLSLEAEGIGCPTLEQKLLTFPRSLILNATVTQHYI